MTGISIYTKNHPEISIKFEKIPLYKGRDDSRVLYISGIALQLSKSENLPSLEIANLIVSHLLVNPNNEYKVQIVPPGWIHLQVADSTLSIWLQNLSSVSQNSTLNTQRSTLNSPLFTAQYAHARCCSLMRMAQSSGLIPLNSPSLRSIPWLDGDEKLRLHDPASRRLISKLIEVVDDLEPLCFKGSGNWGKAALNLSQAFDNFWQNCRIWGEVKTIAPELAQARIGLVMATQLVLKLVLEEKLGIYAPLEL
jgi:arginyl-tRNA synthetase